VEKKLPEKLAEIRKEWAQGENIKLMLQDEARFGRISDVRRCWAPKPLRPICQAMLTHEYTYVYGAVDVCTGAMDSLILPHVNTDCMQLFLNEVSARHPDEYIVMVIDGAGWHRSDGLKAPANIYLLKLPPYAPELNPIEHVWDELREKFFHNRVFNSLDALEDHLTAALKTLKDDQNTVGSIVSWPWIISSLLISLVI
jgi:transposase